MDGGPFVRWFFGMDCKKEKKRERERERKKESDSNIHGSEFESAGVNNSFKCIQVVLVNASIHPSYTYPI